MSFDIVFQTVRFEGREEITKNAFTGETHSVPASEPLTAVELHSVRQVLEQAGAQGPDPYGCYVISLSDGGEAEVFAKELQSHCMVALRGITPQLAQFLFDLLRAGNWVMLPASENSVALTTAPESIKGVPEDFPEIITVTTADQVRVLLSQGVSG